MDDEKIDAADTQRNRQQDPSYDDDETVDWDNLDETESPYW